jgi:alpha-glutamyl/putrescinyl thymine pyrophosphorylase clade 1
MEDDMKFPLLKEIVAFADERENIRKLKDSGKPRPWTRDPILGNFSFTNVHREDDKQTRLIARYWRGPYSTNRDLWFAMFVARLVNWWPTLAKLRFPVPWDPDNFVNTLVQRRFLGEKTFSGAYIINQMIKGGTGMDKGAYLAKFVLGPLWEDRTQLRPTSKDTLASVCDRWTQYKGVGGFIAAQVIADLKYVDPLHKAKDWYSWAASGPGSRRGLNLVLGDDKDKPWEESMWLVALQDLQQQFNKEVSFQPLHAQDMQNVLCEFSKYQRGSSRTRYPGGIL